MSDLPLRHDPDESLANVPATDGVLARSASPAYAAVVSPTRDGTDECTIFPVGAGESTLVTTWVSAADGSFVSLAEMR